MYIVQPSRKAVLIYTIVALLLWGTPTALSLDLRPTSLERIFAWYMFLPGRNKQTNKKHMAMETISPRR